MCGRFVLMSPGKLLAERFDLEEVPDLEPRYNIAPTQMVAVVRLEKETGRRRLDLLRWGLIPFRSKDPSIGNRLINARAESAADKPAFRQPSNSGGASFPQTDIMNGKRGKEVRNNPT